MTQRNTQTIQFVFTITCSKVMKALILESSCCINAHIAIFLGLLKCSFRVSRLPQFFISISFFSVLQLTLTNFATKELHLFCLFLAYCRFDSINQSSEFISGALHKIYKQRQMHEKKTQGAANSGQGFSA